MKKRLLLLMLLTLTLSGCGGPSTSEMSEAIQTYNRAQLAKQLATLKLKGKEAATLAIKISLPSPKDLVVEKLKHRRLKKIDNGDYTTRVSYTLRVGKQTEKIAAEITLTPTKSGWKVVTSLPL